MNLLIAVAIAAVILRAFIQDFRAAARPAPIRVRSHQRSDRN